MGTLKTRVTTLEKRLGLESAESLAALLRLFSRAGLTRAAVAELYEKESGRTASPVFLQRAERTSALMRAVASAMFATAPSGKLDNHEH